MSSPSFAAVVPDSPQRPAGHCCLGEGQKPPAAGAAADAHRVPVLAGRGVLEHWAQNISCVVTEPRFREDQALLARNDGFVEDATVMVARELQALAALPDAHELEWGWRMQRGCNVLGWQPLAQHVAGLPLCPRLLRLLLGLLRQLHGELPAASKPNLVVYAAMYAAWRHAVPWSERQAWGRCTRRGGRGGGRGSSSGTASIGGSSGDCSRRQGWAGAG